eukprot:1343664-Ditylum_brightwellii.AAC.1
MAQYHHQLMVEQATVVLSTPADQTIDENSNNAKVTITGANIEKTDPILIDKTMTSILDIHDNIHDDNSNDEAMPFDPDDIDENSNNVKVTIT